jgi:hypothetical protein
VSQTLHALRCHYWLLRHDYQEIDADPRRNASLTQHENQAKKSTRFVAAPAIAVSSSASAASLLSVDPSRSTTKIANLCEALSRETQISRELGVLEDAKRQLCQQYYVTRPTPGTQETRSKHLREFLYQAGSGVLSIREKYVPYPYWFIETNL